MRPLLDRESFADEAEVRASALRQELSLGTDAIADAFELLGHLGIEVVRWPMGEDGPDGFYVTKGNLSVVMVNSSKRLGRQRFTAYHELAHHLFDRKNHADSDIFAGKSPIERRANVFAAFFLMPREGVRRWMRHEDREPHGPPKLNPPSIVHLAHHFGVSYEATLYQLHDLGWLKPKAVEELKACSPERIARRLGYDVEADERERGRRVLPPGFVRLALQAYGSGDISTSRLAQLLRTDEDSAVRLAREAGVAQPDLSLDDLAEEARHA